MSKNSAEVTKPSELRPVQRRNVAQPRPATVCKTPIKLKVKTMTRRRSDSKFPRVRTSATKFTPLKALTPPQSPQAPQKSVFDRLYSSGKTYPKQKESERVEEHSPSTSTMETGQDVQTIWTNVKNTESYLNRHLRSKEVRRRRNSASGQQTSAPTLQRNACQRVPNLSSSSKRVPESSPRFETRQKRPQSLKLSTYSRIARTDEQGPKPSTAFAGGDDNIERTILSKATSKTSIELECTDYETETVSSKTSYPSLSSSPRSGEKVSRFESAQLPAFLNYSDSDTTLAPEESDPLDDFSPIQNHYFRFPRALESEDEDPLLLPQDFETNRYISTSTLVEERKDGILKDLVQQALLTKCSNALEKTNTENLPKILPEAVLLIRDGEKLEGIIRLTNLYDHAVAFRIFPPRPIYKVTPATGTLNIGHSAQVKLETDYLSSRLLMNHDAFEIQSTRIQPGYLSPQELDDLWRDVGAEKTETSFAHLILMPYPEGGIDEYFGEQKAEALAAVNLNESHHTTPGKLISLERGGENIKELSNSSAWTMETDRTSLLIQSLLDKEEAGKKEEGEEEQEGNGRQSLGRREQEGKEEEDSVNQGKGCSNSLGRREARKRAKLKASLVFSTGLTVCLISFLYGLHRCSNKK